MGVNVADRRQLQGDDDGESGGKADDTINFGFIYIQNSCHPVEITKLLFIPLIKMNKCANSEGNAVLLSFLCSDDVSQYETMKHE